MLEEIIELDKKALIFLNNLGSESFDGLWLCITNQVYWSPYFLLIFILLYKKIGKQNFILALFFIALIILFSDQTANLFKHTFERLRPCNDATLEGLIREVKSSKSFSFFSGHATNSMATTTFVFLFLRKHFKYAFFLFLFPIIFAYSRIYLGVHFPLDVLTGYSFGIFYGITFYKLYWKLQPKFVK